MTDTQTALAEAWDEGWDACLGAVKVTRAAQFTRGVSFADPDNPYRSKSRKGRGAIARRRAARAHLQAADPHLPEGSDRK